MLIMGPIMLLMMGPIIIYTAPALPAAVDVD